MDRPDTLARMDRDDLLAALDLRGEAPDACRADLVGDGATVRVLPASVPVEGLRDIYRSRAAHLEQQGADSLSADEAADVLDTTDQVELRLGRVEGGPSGYVFQLFLTPDLSRVVACIGIRESDAAGGGGTGVDPQG